MSLSLMASSHPATLYQFSMLSLCHPALNFMDFLLFLRCTILPKLCICMAANHLSRPLPPPNSPRMMISFFKHNHSGANVSPQPSTDALKFLLSQTALDYCMWAWISFPSAVKALIGELYSSSYSLFTIECLSLEYTI